MSGVSMTFTCSCGARWGGLRTAHCGRCHSTFTGISAFDAHKPGECREPTSCGMVIMRVTEGDHLTEIWGTPSTREWWKERGGDHSEHLHE